MPGKARQRKVKNVKRAKEKPFKCMRCDKAFLSLIGLRRHSVEHLKMLQEMKMLKEGHVPDETKLGFGFRGKNKVIIS